MKTPTQISIHFDVANQQYRIEIAAGQTSRDTPESATIVDVRGLGGVPHRRLAQDDICVLTLPAHIHAMLA